MKPCVYFLGVSALLLMSCAGGTAMLEKDGLHHKRCDLFIPFSNSPEGIMISEKWTIDNWYPPFDSVSGWVRKEGREYKGRVFSDRNGDGTKEAYTVYYTDLELHHRENDGVIWIASEELPERFNDKLLDVFLNNYARSLSGNDYRFREGIYGRSSAPSKSFAARILNKERVKFGPFDAVAATIEIVDLNQLKLDPNHRYGFVGIVFARVNDFTRSWENPKKDRADDFIKKTAEGEETPKGIFEIGYFSSPEYFETGLDDFNKFLQQIRIGGVQAFKAPPFVKNARPNTPPQPDHSEEQLKETVELDGENKIEPDRDD